MREIGHDDVRAELSQPALAFPVFGDADDALETGTTPGFNPRIRILQENSSTGRDVKPPERLEEQGWIGFSRQPQLAGIDTIHAHVDKIRQSGRFKDGGAICARRCHRDLHAGCAQRLEEFFRSWFSLAVPFQQITDETVLHSADAGNGIQRLLCAGIAFRQRQFSRRQESADTVESGTAIDMSQIIRLDVELLADLRATGLVLGKNSIEDLLPCQGMNTRGVCQHPVEIKHGGIEVIWIDLGVQLSLLPLSLD